MKKIALIVLTICLISATMWSQEEKKVELYVNTGLSFPSQIPFQTREFSNNFNLGYIFGGGLGYEFYPGVSLICNFDYNKFFYKEDTPIEDNSISIFSVSGNLKATLYTQSNSTFIYIIYGIGFSRFTTSTLSTRLVGPETQSTFAFLFGAGFDATVTETSSFFMESKYGISIANCKEVGYIPLKLGVKFKL